MLVLRRHLMKSAIECKSNIFQILINMFTFNRFAKVDILHFYMKCLET